MADVNIEITVPEAKVSDLQSAVDLDCSSFTVKLLPYSKVGGNKLAYAKYILTQSLKAWYITSLDANDKKTFRSKVQSNKNKDILTS
jgi:hypothetical protein